MVSVGRLKSRLAHSLKAHKVDVALAVLGDLIDREPTNPAWSMRSARLLRVRRDGAGELAALRRALALQMDQGLVLDAIATCKTILELAPTDIDSRDRLLLNCEAHARVAHDSGDSHSEAPAESSARSRTEASDAPLESLVLSQLIPGARPVTLADGVQGRAHEIPVDENSASSDSPPIDLRLDGFDTETDLNDLAAAQAACLPSRLDLERFEARQSDPGASLKVELANIELFGDLDPASLHTLIRRVRVVRLDAGDTLFRQGDAATSLYVVVDGAVVPIAEGERRHKLAVLERGEFFGEIGLLTQQPRNATIEAMVDTQLLAIDRGVLWELIEKQPSVAKNILRFLRARLIDRQIRTNLLFAAFAQAERAAVARQFRILEVRDGTRIVQQDQPPEGLFVVLSGRLDRYDRQRGRSVGQLEIGDVFGGLSLLEGRMASTDIVAQGKCWLVVLGEARFRRIVDANPCLVRVLERLEGESTSEEAPRAVVTG
jgi:CRP-like cAMP-binding protein